MKNKMMRIASALLVAVLLTTCVISGTFAKYVTSTSGSDTARVAKFGVQLSAAGDSMFSNEYATDDTSSYSGELTVKSIDDAKVVAPGTKSTVGAAFAISGTPEVATKIEIKLENVQDVFLKAGTYKDFTVSPFTGTFTLANDYYPVVYTLKQGTTTIAEGNLAAITAAIDTFNASATYAPNTVLDADFSLTWEWKFEQSDELYNKADTLLGNLATNAAYFGEGSLTAGDDYNLTLKYDLTVTVTQVD